MLATKIMKKVAYPSIAMVSVLSLCFGLHGIGAATSSSVSSSPAFHGQTGGSSSAGSAMSRSGRNRRQVLATATIAMRLQREGVEPFSAGFHFVRPANDPAVDGRWLLPFLEDGVEIPPTPAPPSDFRSTATRFILWHTDSYSPQEYSFPQIDDYPLVSASRAFSNSFADYSEHQNADGTYSVSATFSARGRSALFQIISELTVGPSGRKYDWAGLRVPPGYPPSECILTVVSSNVAYDAIQAASIAEENSTQSLTVELASGLSWASARRLLRRLQRS